MLPGLFSNNSLNSTRRYPESFCKYRIGLRRRVQATDSLNCRLAKSWLSQSFTAFGLSVGAMSIAGGYQARSGCMQHVAMMSFILQVGSSIVELISVLMVYLLFWRTRTKEQCSNPPMYMACVELSAARFSHLYLSVPACMDINTCIQDAARICFRAWGIATNSAHIRNRVQALKVRKWLPLFKKAFFFGNLRNELWHALNYMLFYPSGLFPNQV